MSELTPMKVFLPEWDDSDVEEVEDKRYDYTTSLRNTRTPTPKEVKVHPHPSGERRASRQYQQHEPISMKSAPVSQYALNSNSTANQHKHLAQKTSYHIEPILQKGSVHENEILKFREILLQSVESVQCINETLDGVCEYIKAERTVDEKVRVLLD